MKVFVKGLNGCWVRKTDIQRYCDFLTANGHELVDDPKGSDATLLWTCAFRSDYRDNSLSEMERYQKEFNTKLIVAGCLPDIDPELLEKKFDGEVMAWCDDEKKLEAFFGATKKKLSDIPRNLSEKKLYDDVATLRKENPDVEAAFADQFIKLHIQEGCKFQCAYCSEILAFPPYRSFPMNEIMESCKQVVADTGVHDVMLLGDSIGDYGHDIGQTLSSLMRELKTIHPDLKFALHAFNPTHFIQFYDDIKYFLLNGDIAHLCLPIQSASPQILRSMKRPYTRDGLDKIFTLLNDIGFKEFETHLIIGFPGETEADYEESINFVLHYRPKYVLASGFMEAPGAPASKFPNKVDKEIIVRRLKSLERRLNAAGIICNTDNSELSVSRFKGLNNIGSGSLVSKS